MSQGLLDKIAHLEAQLATARSTVSEQRKELTRLGDKLEDELRPFTRVQFIFPDGESPLAGKLKRTRYHLGTDPVMHLRDVPRTGDLVEFMDNDSGATHCTAAVLRLLHAVDPNQDGGHTVEVHVRVLSEGEVPV